MLYDLSREQRRSINNKSIDPTEVPGIRCRTDNRYNSLYLDGFIQGRRHNTEGPRGLLGAHFTNFPSCFVFYKRNLSSAAVIFIEQPLNWREFEHCM
jgi:hypothetical protein